MKLYFQKDISEKLKIAYGRLTRIIHDYQIKPHLYIEKHFTPRPKYTFAQYLQIKKICNTEDKNRKIVNKTFNREYLLEKGK